MRENTLALCFLSAAAAAAAAKVATDADAGVEEVGLFAVSDEGLEDESERWWCL